MKRVFFLRSVSNSKKKKLKRNIKYILTKILHVY